MSSRSLAIFAGLVLVIVAASLFFLNTDTPTLGPAVAEATPIGVPAPATPRPPAPDFASKATPKPRPASAAVSKPSATPRPLAPWEHQIDEVLRSSADETQTAQILINMLPSLPAEGQEEAAEHISNLLLDEDYAKVLPLVRNPNLPEEVLDVFVTDLMNREDSVKLPALLDIARIPNHPAQEEALTDLEIFLDEDYGSDWTRWQAAMDKYLKEQAAEDAEDAKMEAGGLQPGAGGARLPGQ